MSGRSTGSCNVCEQVGVDWEWFGPNDSRARCPNCRSLDRHRHLALLLERLRPLLASSEVVLEYGPNPMVRKVLKATTNGCYVGLDISTKSRRVDLVADACTLPFDRGSIDLAVCFHVLEHIPDDIGALAEMHRVLGRGGVALIQSPWRRSTPTDEDPDAPPTTEPSDSDSRNTFASTAPISTTVLWRADSVSFVSKPTSTSLPVFGTSWPSRAGRRSGCADRAVAAVRRSHLTPAVRRVIRPSLATPFLSGPSAGEHDNWRNGVIA